VFVPLNPSQPGETFQFDWSEDWATVGSKPFELYAAHTKLLHSRAYAVRAYMLQTNKMLFDALPEAFRIRWRAAARHLRQYADGRGSR